LRRSQPDVLLRAVGKAAIAKASRIAIVGAGPAGLSAALALRAAGFTKVTVFEKADQVGGKCLTVEYQPGVTYELGASSMTGNYTKVFELIERYKLSLKPVESSRFLNTNEAARDPTQGPWESSLFCNVLTLLASILQRSWLLRRDLRLLEPGFGKVTRAELAKPFSKTLKEQLDEGGLGQLEQTARTLVSGIGYGYIDEVPSAYHLKYLSLWVPLIQKLQIHPREYELFQVGFQGLFQRVADDLGEMVRTSSPVTGIQRNPPGDANPICLTIAEKEEVNFDYLILACPLDEAARMLNDRNAVEDRLRGLESYTFHSILTEIKGYPAVRWQFLMQNHFPDRTGRPVLTARRHVDLDRVVFYVLDKAAPAIVKNLPGPRQLHLKDHALADVLDGGTGIGKEQVGAEVAEYLRETTARLQTELAAANLTDMRPVEHVVWKYFPHFSVADVKAGLPLDLEMNQGKRNTFYAGEALDFSAVERVVRYSQHLVQTHFA
jgi:hypothetical protein